ncbi:MAG TPA: hypothetical protein VGR06_30355 [Actinophytocola sp.]|jgi:hypothetical protein|uniref:hypothetical protein n=1 Tax=Actinophytocola sp. TaxID=1872138 RepID=UPI002E0B0513|nr:hypothetical protein [Actinophytocola sp.]
MADRPADKLVEPQAKETIPGPIDEVLSIGDWLNVSHWVMKAIELVTGGVNPGQWAVDQFTGDWEAFSKAGDALKHVGEFDAAYAKNLTEGKDAMFTGWQGHAATKANTYFTGLAGAVAAQQQPLSTMGTEMQTAAFGIWGVAKTLDSLLESLLDALIGAGIALAAAAATSETIIGGIIGGVAAAWEIKEAVTIWKQAIEAHDMAYNIAIGLSGTIAGLLGALHGLKDHPLPAGAYDHPGV